MNRDPHAAPLTLLLHDGELADLRALLGDLGTPLTERRGPLCPEDRDTPWDLVLATPRRLLRLNLDPAHRPALIAVVDEDSRTLRNSLWRAGIRLVVRRPVHPAALRAVILHALYRGPEKRRNARVSVGAPVRFRQGWRRRSAILADLSIGGCRLLTEHPAEVGRSLTLRLPADLAGGKALSARARVLRTAKASGEPPGTRVVTARFERVSPRLHYELKRAVAAYASGPATFEADDRPDRPDAPEPDAAPAAPAASDAAEPARAPAAVVEPGERREGPRHALDRRVIALGDEASRVLMGRDISVGGMRVDPNPHLRVGDDLQLAIHLGDREHPLVLHARVHRDDGERGVVLRFHGLSAEATRYLNRTIDGLPVVEADGGEGVLVTEIVGTPGPGPTA